MKGKKWTAQMLDYLKRHFPRQPTAFVAAELGRSTYAVSNKAHEMGLKKNPEVLLLMSKKLFDSGKSHRFKKGHEPHNKGRSMPTRGRQAESQFRKECVPHNQAKIGAIVKTPSGYLKQKIAYTKPPRFGWVFMHVALWEQHNGPVPSGHIIVFKNGKKDDLRIENLECISRKENMRRNTFHNLPPEYAHVVQLRGALNRQINKREKNEQSI
jgi:hypothetical protein